MTLSSTLLVGACGDNKPGPGGGGDVDAGPDEDVVRLEDPEGGNIIFEFIYFDTELQAAFGLPSGVTTVNRVMAYFLNGQNPQSTALPALNVCNNLELTKGWPMVFGSDHQYLDVGTLTINGVNTASEPVQIEVAKDADGGLDSIGRPHDLFYQALNPVAEDFIKFNTSYDVVFGGGADIPATTFEDAIFMSESFNIATPGLEDNGPLVAGTDFTVTWDPAESSNLPPGDEVLGVVWLVDSNGSPTHMCPTLHSAGTFTIPGSAITEYQAVAQARGAVPAKVILLRNAIVHKLERLPNGDPENKRRVDMLSVNCWAQLMDVQ